MNLLYIEEHTACNNYVSGFNTGFRVCNLKTNEVLKSSATDYNCLIFTTEGSVNLYYDDVELLLAPNTIAFVPLPNIFDIKAITESTLIINYFNKPIELCEKLTFERLANFIDENDNNYKTLPIIDIINKYLESLVSVLDSGARCKHFFAIKHQELIFLLRFYYPKEQLAQFLAPIISKDINFKTIVLKNHLKANNVKHLAELCHYSIPVFNREFLKNFNEPPLRWLNKRRCEHIKARLKDKSIPFSHIIDDFGFSSAAHFTVFCKKHFGRAPRDIRRSYMK